MRVCGYVVQIRGTSVDIGTAEWLWWANSEFPSSLSLYHPFPSAIVPFLSSPLSTPHLLLSPLFWSPLFFIFYFFGRTHPSYINDHNLTITNPIMKKSKFLSVLNDEDLYYRVTWCESAQLEGEKNLSCGLQLLSRLQAACLSPSTTESPAFRTVLGVWSLLSREHMGHG